MSSLHTISRSPRSQLLESCLASISDDDAILFIEDGVYHCANQDLLSKIPAKINCFGLKEDISARGLKVAEESSLDIANYRKFVELCTQYDKVISWF
ncbi:MAG: sulfurtransferase complex subunit TusB [Pseudomonadales bacterium]|nr:sulfurtransferase complex subunit TusB [Pseudomonadales bacterium]